MEEAFVQCARKILNKIESGRGAGGERARRGPPAPCVASRCFGAAGQRAWSPLTRQPTTATWGSAPLPLAPGPPTGTRLDLRPRSQPLLGRPCVLARGVGYSTCPWLLRTRLCEAKGPRLHGGLSRYRVLVASGKVHLKQPQFGQLTEPSTAVTDQRWCLSQRYHSCVRNFAALAVRANAGLPAPRRPPGCSGAVLDGGHCGVATTGQGPPGRGARPAWAWRRCRRGLPRQVVAELCPSTHEGGAGRGRGQSSRGGGVSWEAGGGRHWTEAAAGRGGRHAEAGRPRASGASS